MKNCILDSSLGANYTSQSQKIRIITETWTEKHIFCPNCGFSLINLQNNRPVADYTCSNCSEEFELKSKKGSFSKKLPAGAYSKMIERLNEHNKPNFFLLNYQPWLVDNFFVIPKHFFIPGIIEKRKALSKEAKRAGWVGCNILFSKIPNAGKIYYIENGTWYKKENILEKWNKTVFVKKLHNEESKGWIFDIMNCIDDIQADVFTLEQLYQYEDQLTQLHQNNKNIKAKIRQQLQILRDKKYLTFLGNGSYKLN